MADKCSPYKDFLRHIVNRVLSNYAEKVPANILDDIRKHIGRAEDKYRFTVFGGDPSKLVDYFNSDDWRDLVEYLRNLHMEWILKEILNTLIAEYSQNCPQVVETARKAAEGLETKGEERKIDRDTVYRSLKYAGYKVEIAKDGGIEVEEPNIRVRIEITNNKLHYRICKEGTASTLDAVMARIEKIREL